MDIKRSYVIGISIVSVLADQYDDDDRDSMVKVDDIYTHIKNNYKISVSGNDIDMVVNILNKTSSIKNFLSYRNIYTNMYAMIQELFIYTKVSKYYLKDIVNQLENELRKA